MSNEARNESSEFDHCVIIRCHGFHGMQVIVTSFDSLFDPHCLAYEQKYRQFQPQRGVMFSFDRFRLFGTGAGGYFCAVGLSQLDKWLLWVFTNGNVFHPIKSCRTRHCQKSL